MNTKVIKEEWDLDFATQTIISKPVARIYLGDDACIRLIRLPNGVHAFLPPSWSPFVHDTSSDAFTMPIEITRELEEDAQACSKDTLTEALEIISKMCSDSAVTAMMLDSLWLQAQAFLACHRKTKS